MPSRAARWISWITSRLKIAPSRRPGRQPRPAERRSTSSRALPSVSNSVKGSTSWGQTPLGWLRVASVRPRVVDVEVVELPCRSVAFEVRRRAALHLGALQEPGQLGHVLLAHLLLDAVGAEGGDGPAHVQVRLVDRVAERSEERR